MTHRPYTPRTALSTAHTRLSIPSLFTLTPAAEFGTLVLVLVCEVEVVDPDIVVAVAEEDEDDERIIPRKTAYNCHYKASQVRFAPTFGPSSNMKR